MDEKGDASASGLVPRGGAQPPLHTFVMEDHKTGTGSPLSNTYRGNSSRSTISLEVDHGATVAVLHKGTLEAPNFGWYQMILASLLLTTILALASAFDARNECIEQELYAWFVEFFDDDLAGANRYYDDYISDFAIQEGRAECLKLFEYVIVPVGVTTWVLGALALGIIRHHLKNLENLSEHLASSHSSVLVKLFLIFFVILIAWTCAIFSVMLIPKVNPSLYNQNPFKSLAAVDEMGRIGDNANLYYLSWTAQAQIMCLAYHAMVEYIRRFQRRLRNDMDDESRNFAEEIMMHEQIQTMLSFNSARKLATAFKKRRKKWYQFMYHLRERSGMWVAALFSSLTLLASSGYVFVQVLVSLASSLKGDENLRYRDVCAVIQGTEELPMEYCARTSFAVIAGVVASALCVLALIMHILVRRQSAMEEDRPNSCTVMATQVLSGSMDPESYRLHLALEFVFSFCLSLLLGANAVLATGVQGPAAKVGNLYYASWVAFLLCLRICLGCVEELYHVRASLAEGDSDNDRSKRCGSQASSVSGSEMSIDIQNYKRMAKKERQSHLRKYFFLAIFSAICFASAQDAAYNQQTYPSREQKYLMFAPAAVAIVAVIMFVLCLNPSTYSVASHICIGGLLSVVCFGVWLLDLVLLMHTEDSWAVNGIGEMKLANLYYFSWASIITAGLQVLSYTKPLFGTKTKDASFLIWSGIVKVCMVILGASSHVWHNISESCSSEELEDGERSFCSRTRMAQAVGLVGWVMGWMVILSRFLCSISESTRNRAETALSFVLVVLFGTAVALITSIGGPGQTVGDLYYSAWLAFWVAVGIFVSCYGRLSRNEIEYDETTSGGDEDTPYVDMEALESPIV